MACILLDVDGVLHVSGEPIPGAVEAVVELRRCGHSLRFVTNNSTAPRATIVTEMRGLGFELDADEVQTTPRAAVRQLAGKRVLALVMPSVVPELEGLELVGDGADAVLVGGCDESLEPNTVFSYMNLGRAFDELRAGAELYCMHKGKWWQTSRGPLVDSGLFTAGLEYVSDVEAIVLGKPSAAFYAAALDALDAEPALTWMVGDDIEADIAGAQAFGMRTALVRTGKFRPEALEESNVVPDAVLSSIAQLPEWLEQGI
jgi:HAD superfamily hydrolase (TIGR01458 family)